MAAALSLAGRVEALALRDGRAPLALGATAAQFSFASFATDLKPLHADLIVTADTPVLFFLLIAPLEPVTLVSQLHMAGERTNVPFHDQGHHQGVKT